MRVYKDSTKLGHTKRLAMGETPTLHRITQKWKRITCRCQKHYRYLFINRRFIRETFIGSSERHLSLNSFIFIMSTEYLTLKEAATLFNISVSFLYKLRAAGKIDFHKLSRKSYVRKSELEMMIERQIK